MGEKAKRLRQLLTNKEELLIMVVVGTAHEAQLAEKVGFKVLHKTFGCRFWEAKDEPDISE